jgi:hypothetical protein
MMKEKERGSICSPALSVCNRIQNLREDDHTFGGFEVFVQLGIMLITHQDVLQRSFQGLKANKH